MARDRRRSSRAARRATARWPASSVLVVLGILVAINYIGKRQNKRWDLTAAQAVQPVGSEPQRPREARRAAARSWSSPQNTEFQPFRDRLQEYEYASKQVTTEYIDPGQEADASRSRTRCSSTARSSSTTRAAPSASRPNTEQDITNAHHQGRSAASSGRSTSRRATARRTRRRPSATATGTIAEALEARELRRREARPRADRARCPTTRSVVVVAGPQTDFFPPEIDALKKYLGEGRQAAAGARSARTPRRAAADRTWSRWRSDWGIDVGNNVVVDVSGMGQLFGTDASVPVAATYPAHPITERFNVMTAYPLARSVTPVSGGVERPHRADLRRDERPQLGRDRPQGAAHGRPGRRWTRRRATSRARSSIGGRGVGAGQPRQPPQPDAAKPERRRAEAGDPRRGVRRLRLRVERACSASRATATCS